MTFQIYPAIDLRRGQVVRLRQGSPSQQIIFEEDPIKVAQRWIAAGAAWLHVINLDGAFDEIGAENWKILPKLVALKAQVQFGGGVRTLDDVERVLDAGVARVMLGTVAIEKPRLVAQAIEEFGATRVIVAIDALNGRVKTRGWQMDTVVNPIQLGQQMQEMGVKTIVYTDIGRDGELSGVNATETAELARVTKLNVIASGGVAALEDVQRAYEYAGKGLVGIVIGRALYEEKIDLQQAIRIVGA